MTQNETPSIHLSSIRFRMDVRANRRHPRCVLNPLPHGRQSQQTTSTSRMTLTRLRMDIEGNRRRPRCVRPPTHYRADVRDDAKRVNSGRGSCSCQMRPDDDISRGNLSLASTSLLWKCQGPCAGFSRACVYAYVRPYK